MEKRIEQKVDEYIDTFKGRIKSWIEENDTIDFKIKSNLLQFVYDYDKLEFEKTDFAKRSRIKSSVPHYLRCTAKRASGEQCTRKKREGYDYCGTHDKNRPHGIIENIENNVSEIKKIEVWIQEINGIMYYIDNNYNIYKTEDILSNIHNPKIIAKYSVINDNYVIEK